MLKQTCIKYRQVVVRFEFFFFFYCMYAFSNKLLWHCWHVLLVTFLQHLYAVKKKRKGKKEKFILSHRVRCPDIYSLLTLFQSPPSATFLVTIRSCLHSFLFFSRSLFFFFFYSSICLYGNQVKGQMLGRQRPACVRMCQISPHFCRRLWEEARHVYHENVVDTSHHLLGIAVCLKKTSSECQNIWSTDRYQTVWYLLVHMIWLIST